MLRYFNFAPHHGFAFQDAYFTTPQPCRLNRLYHQPAQAVRPWDSEVRLTEGGAVMGSEIRVAKHVNSGWQEKALTIA